jgi:hypothetical protein
MRGFSKLLLLVSMTTALIVPISTAAAATTSVNYKIAGVASTTMFPQISFAGAAVSVPKGERGVWTAAVQQDLGAIVGGTFTFKSRVHALDDTIAGGSFAMNPGGTCAKTTFAVHGVLTGGGSFDVTMARYGSTRNGTCVVYFATVRGTATIVFPV